MEKLGNYRLPIIFALIAVAVMSRLLPHPQNFSPVMAIALFSGVLLGKKWYAWVVPMAIMVISDCFLGFSDVTWSVYLSFALIIGMGMMMKKVSLLNVFANSLLGALLFFVITNFACWLPGWYGYTWQGLMDCYVAAIPYFRMTVLSSVVYGVAFWGLYELARRFAPALIRQ